MTAVAAVSAASPAPLTRWVLACCGGRPIALPLAGIREISPPLPATRVPGCGPEVYGLVGLRGRVVTVCDLGAALARRPSARLPDHRLLLLERNGRLVGAAVDAVRTVLDASPVPGPAEGLHSLPGLEPGDVRGACEIAGERYIAVEIERVMRRLLA